MGDDALEKFPKDDATALLEIAALPEIYERALYKAGQTLGDRWAWNGQNTEANGSAFAQMKSAAPDNVADNLKVVKFENTTAIIAYDPKSHNVTVTFDPTSDRDNVQFNQDEIDNFVMSPTPHSLGGEVHSGLYSDLVQVDPAREASLVDQIAGILHDYAYAQDKPLSVDFTGFSKGGSQAALAAGELMAQGVFEQENNITLHQVVLYGTPAYGDCNYIDAFNQKAHALGADVWTVELHGDAVPTVLTPDGSNYFTQHDYGQVGERAYISASGEIVVIENKDQLDALRSEERPEDSMHGIDHYRAALEVESAGQADNITQLDIVPAVQSIVRP